MTYALKNSMRHRSPALLNASARAGVTLPPRHQGANMSCAHTCGRRSGDGCHTGTHVRGIRQRRRNALMELQDVCSEAASRCCLAGSQGPRLPRAY